MSPLKKKNFEYILNTFGMPVTLMVFGLVLLLNPDSAAIVITRLLGWVLSMAGILYGIYALIGDEHRRIGRFVTAGVCLILGSTLQFNPLILARNIGRFLGVLLAVEGGHILHKNAGSKTMGILTLVGAVVLVMAPMTASRMVFSLCGLVLLCIGGGQLLERLRKKKLGKGPDKPDIIDAL